MEESVKTKQPLFKSVRTGLIKINKDRNVDRFLKINAEYYMYLTQSDSLIHVKCIGVGIRGADLKILSTTKNGKSIKADEGSVFGYQYEHFDAVHFNSFEYREKCEIYQEEPIYTMRHMDALVDDL